MGFLDTSRLNFRDDKEMKSETIDFLMESKKMKKLKKAKLLSIFRMMILGILIHR